MLRIVATIGALLTGIALLLMGTGLLNTLVPLRGDAEGFSDQVLGLFGSACFAGFMLGTWLCPRLIRRMGHIRAFAFFAAGAAACIILHVMFVQVTFWLVLRLATGLMLVGVYTSIERCLPCARPSVSTIGAAGVNVSWRSQPIRFRWCRPRLRCWKWRSTSRNPTRKRGRLWKRRWSWPLAGQLRRQRISPRSADRSGRRWWCR